MRTFIIAILLFIGTATAYAQPKSPGSDSIDVIRYSINIDTLDIAAKQLHGYTDIYFQPRVNNLQYIPLDLLELNVDSVFLESTLNTTWTYNDTLLMIQSPVVLTDNDTFHLKIFYHGSPVVDPSGWGGFYFQSPYAFNLGVGFEDNPHNYGRVWFPCIDDFTDKAFYEIIVRTDTNQMAVCGGMLTDSTHIENEEIISWTWTMAEPIPTYLASIAVGPYVCVTDTFNGINGNIPIDIYVSSSYVAKVPGTFIHLKDILATFENRFGPYGWERVGYVGVPFNSGAMEHATNIALPNATITGNTSYESLIYHELSHHWFGDLVTCATAEEMWINEGWAVFCEFITEESLYGTAAMQDYIRTMLASVLRFAHVDDGGFYPVGNVPHQITYGTTVYDKGALVAHTLRNYIGDSLFFPALKQYFDSLKYGNATIIQMRDILSAETGMDLTDFFDAWVLREGFPHFDVDSMHVVPNGTGSTVTVFLKQKLYGTTQYANSNRVELTFLDSLWNKHTVTTSFSGQNGTDVFNVPFIPTLVITDLNEKTADAIVSYNTVISEPSTIGFNNAFVDIIVNNISDSIFVRAEHHKVSPDQQFTDPDIFRISESRYWRITGIIPPGTEYQLRFDYNRTSNFFDTDLMPQNDCADSVILVYRPGPGYDWQPFPFTKTGNDYSGILKTPYGLLGEYALAVGQPNQSGLSDNDSESKLLIFPNPCSDELRIGNIPQNSTAIAICDMTGKIILKQHLSNHETSTTIDIRSIAAGEYIVNVIGRNGQMKTKSTLTVIGTK
ncbi:MAG: M1 family aminopeptidase [Bacteroidales bacterium]